MRRIQENRPVKGIVALLLVLSVFLGGMLGFEAFSLLPYAEADSWQETGRFRVLLRERENQIAQGVAYGTASHVIGTTRASELSQLTGAVSSLSLTIAGIATTVLLSFLSQFV